MTDPRCFEVRLLAPADLALVRAMIALFGKAFDDPHAYGAAPPSDAYLCGLLARDDFIALAAVRNGNVAGALAAYVLRKFERERAEVYVYDLAIDEPCRRQGIATALIEALRPIARSHGAWVIYVQADLGDPAAIALYTKLGVREEVLHFDIAVG